MDLSLRDPSADASAPAAWVLRVLHGLHAGSEVPVDAEWHTALTADGLRLGHSLDNDLVLLDAPSPALRLRLQDQALQLLGLDGNALAPPADPSIEWLPLGNAESSPVLGLFAPGTPWPTASALQQRLRQRRVAPTEPELSDQPLADRAAPEPALDPSATGGAAAAPSSATLSAPAMPSPMPEPVRPNTAPWGAGPGLWLVGGAALLVLMAVVWLVLGGAAPRAPSNAGVTPAASTPGLSDAQRVAAQAALTATRAVLAQQGLNPAPEAKLLPNGQVKVQAQGLDDESLERLAAALSRLTPRPALEVSSAQDVLGALRDWLARTDETLTATAIGPQRFRVEGKVPDANARERLAAGLKQAFPGALFNLELATPAELATQLLAELKAQGLGDVSGQWDGQALKITAKVPRSEVPRWEQALANANRSAGTWVPLNAALQVTSDPPVSRPTEASFPFAVRSVVGGASPYLMLSTGQKLMTGGTLGEWRLVSIDDARITLDGPRRLVIPRQ